MQLENTFTVPVSVDEAWRVLLNVEEVAPCMPGATVESVDGDDITGRVRVKLGPISLTYRGTVKFIQRDEAARRVVIAAAANETRGGGTANATITTVLRGRDGQTAVTVTTDLNVTGKPAQFGRGVIGDVSERIIQQFATSLAAKIAAGELSGNGSGPEPAPATPAASALAQPSSAPAVPPAPRPSAEAIDLLGTAGAPLIKRVGPVLVGVVVGFVLGWLIARGF